MSLALILGISGLAQACILSGLWWVLFHKLGHGAEWLLVAVLPLSGLFLIPIVSFMINFTAWQMESAILWNSVATGFLGFVFSAAPLAVLVARVLQNKIPGLRL
ncbi:hypothetical protein [Cognatiyoonia koreensis]|uniref:hypothetical protein n=1 Tax=Cognatiyoonia koreensis TaxID=364200 RepID=UPI0010426A53|nr:hypothetical protein [Cognatiyoonia koreensis]